MLRRRWPLLLIAPVALVVAVLQRSPGQAPPPVEARLEAPVVEGTVQPRAAVGVASPAAMNGVEPSPVEAGGLVAGQVVDVQQQGIADARVVFTSGAARVEVQTKPTGHFEARLPDGAWRLVAVMAAGCESVGPELELDVGPQTEVRGLRFVLSAEWATLVQDERKQPVAGASVEVRGNRHGLRSTPGVLPQRSDRDGVLYASFLPGDDVVIRHPDFEEGYLAEAQVEDRVLAGRVRRVRQLALIPRGTGRLLRFRVVDQDREPVERIEVSGEGIRPMVLFEDRTAGDLTPISYGDGGYAVRLRTANPQLWVRAFEHSYELKPHAEGEQLIRVVRPTAWVTGRVLRADGTPPPAFALRFVSVSQMVRRTVFSPDGCYRVALMPGKWMVHAEAFDQLPAEKVFVVERDDVSVELTLGAGRTVSGVVTDRVTRQPIAAAEVEDSQREMLLDGFPAKVPARTDARGSFTLAAAPLARFEVTARAPGYAERSVHVLEGQESVSIELAPTKTEDAKEWEGIGGRLDHTSGGHWRFKSFVPGAGATSAGLLAGDELLAVDGVNPDGFDVDEVVARLRGPAGTVVHLQVQRGDKTFDFNVVRRLLKQE